MTRVITPDNGAAWAGLFESFNQSAFRLEGLQTYSEPLEAEALARFVAGKPHGLDTSWWRSMVSRHHDAGQPMTRVRVITEPLTDYTRFELAIYPDFVKAGEDIRILQQRANESRPEVPEHDYWLFDNKDLWLMHYDQAGAFQRADLVDDPSAVAEHCRWRDATISRSVPLQQYLRDQRVRESVELSR